jgi:hypothetical protein
MILITGDKAPIELFLAGMANWEQHFIELVQAG